MAENKGTAMEEHNEIGLGASPEFTEGIPTTDEVVNNRPGGWKYKERRIGSLVIPWYASPTIQLLMVSFVCFLCPGMFNALGGMGGGGKSDPTLADNMVSDICIPSTVSQH